VLSVFALHYDAGARELLVSVTRPEQDPALDALVTALDAASRTTSQADRH
jgi:hypothetical protein